MYIKYLLSLLLFFLFSCHGDKPQTLNFFEVNILQINATELGALTLTGQLKKVANLSDISEQGFVYSTNIEDVQTLSENVSTVNVPTLEDDLFSTEITNLSIESTYYFRAFAKGRDENTGERIAYSELITPFSFQVQLTMSANAERINDQLVVSSAITGLETLSISVENQGFVYSTNENATLNINEHDVVEVGDNNDDTIFSDTLKNLSFNTTYYVQSFAQTTNQVYYSTNKLAYKVTDGWRQIVNPGSPLKSAVGIAHQGKGYVVLGENQFGQNESIFILDLNATSPDFWSAVPLSNFESIDFPNYFNQIKNNCIGFSLDEFLYFGFGHDNNNIFWPDIYRFHPDESATFEFATGAFTRRADAVTFTLNGKAYLGAGRDDNGEPLNDFWEYNPVTSMWRQIASLPLKVDETSPIAMTNAGRVGASVFAFDNATYVGGGFKVGLQYRDFWKFNPPANDTDMGSWGPDSFFPGEGRRKAVSFVLNAKGYYGLGHKPSNGGFTDFWEFNPPNNWELRAEFVGQSRTGPIFFGLNNRGIVGGGEIYFIDGIAITPQVAGDFWMYIPEE